MHTVKNPINQTLSLAVDNHRGVAILIAIGVVAVLLTAGLELNRRVRNSVIDAIHQRDRLVLTQMAVSGVHTAMVMLINDRKDSETDTLQEDWADPEKVAQMVQIIPFDIGVIDVRIVDEKGKIQINALVKFPEGQQFSAVQRSLWERLTERVFSTFEEVEDSEPAMIINSLKDWLDSGDDDAITGLSGAESDYYEDHEPPYSCKNGPFDHLGEVALVQGITPEIFFGAGGVDGLSSLLTVYGTSTGESETYTFDGKVNISTADTAVLSALLPSENADLADALADYRVEKSEETFTNDITNAQWYKNMPGSGDINLDANLITVSSDLFRIISKATINNKSVQANVVVQREKEADTDRWICKALNWQVE